MAGTIKDLLDAADPNTLPDVLRKLAFGGVVQALPTTCRKKVPAASSVQLGTLHAVALPDGAKAHVIHRAYARAATAGTGELAVVAYGTTPATGQIAVAPNGDIVTLAADAITDLDLTYTPEKGDVVELSLPVSSNVLTIPAAYTALGTVMLLAANATAGTVTGTKIVLVPSASAAATGQARFDLAKATVKFAPADAVTMATVKLLVAASADTAGILASSAFQ